MIILFFRLGNGGPERSSELSKTTQANGRSGQVTEPPAPRSFAWRLCLALPSHAGRGFASERRAQNSQKRLHRREISWRHKIGKGAEVRGRSRDEFCCPAPTRQRHAHPEPVQSPVLLQAVVFQIRFEAQHLSDLVLKIPSEKVNVIKYPAWLPRRPAVWVPAAPSLPARRISAVHPSPTFPDSHPCCLLHYFNPGVS